MSDLMTTQEVAAYLRLKERKVYDLVRKGRIPCTRVTGRWLFPKAQVDLWLASTTALQEGLRPPTAPVPPVVAGSQDPLLEWCLAESACGLALLAGGSLDGLARLARQEAMVSGVHVLDPEEGEYNIPAIRRMLPGLDVVAIEWAEREQGFVVAPGNPLRLSAPADLKPSGARLICRQAEAGAQILLARILEEAGLTLDALSVLPQPARSEIEVGLAVLDGRADAGLAIRAVARQLRLDFVPLRRERYDLVLRRRDYFEPPVQKLLAFAASPAAKAKAADLEGYDTANLGRVRYNAP